MLSTAYILLASPIGPFAIGWALVLLTLSASVRFRWSVVYVLVSVGLVIATTFGILAYYENQQVPQGGYAIEGPEIFGAALLIMGSVVFAGLVLVLGGIVALFRRSAIAGRQERSVIE